ncbi:HGGxSTG domain-containing protein [Marinobacterium sp. YM272]|uniref:HGGxSTG domain-containing protein n=1 Tax=Marinobacterium sp. YM272 TaxID=3421654 RepID=UPI003D7FBA71
MKCGAKTRKGTPCSNDGTAYPNGRCKFHGGASTGPRTPEGRKRSSRNSSKTNPMET